VGTRLSADAAGRWRRYGPAVGVAFLVLVLVGGLVARRNVNAKRRARRAAKVATAVVSTPRASTAAPAKPNPGADPTAPLARLRFVAVGDIIPHEAVKRAAAAAEAADADPRDGGGFAELWRDLRPLIGGADIAFANLETPIAPTSGHGSRAFVFNAPASLPTDLRRTGFNVVSVANNHAYDQGVSGLAETLSRLKNAGVLPVGAGVTRDRAGGPLYLNRRGLRIAVLGYTDLLNVNLNSRADKPWVSRLGENETLGAVRDARQRADLVIVSVHWGNEYQRKPSPRQMRFARALAEAGADLVVGHHPHVLQPMETIRVGDRKSVIAYSLGNFVSNQARTYTAARQPIDSGDQRDGAALVVSFAKVRTGEGSTAVVVEDASYEPLWCDNATLAGRGGGIHVLPINATIDNLLAEIDRLTRGAAAAPQGVTASHRILELQEQVRTLALRRARIERIVTAPFAARP
jgi:poly-gamma-glutamate synthesis protein (capsule biosynthesis protein)